MTYLELAGCVFITFGPPASLFIITVARNPLRVILMMASAFFWLVALLFSSLIWLAAKKLENAIVLGLIFSVIFQEVFRFLFYFLLRKARKGLEEVANQGEAAPKPLNMMSIYYVVGLGYGLVSGAFATVNLFKDLNGPGTVGIQGDSEYFSLISAFTALGFIALNTFWGIIFMGALDTNVRVKQALGVITVTGSHLLVSGITLSNKRDTPVYQATLTVTYIFVLLMGICAYKIAGGSSQSIKHFVRPPMTPSQEISNQRQD